MTEPLVALRRVTKRFGDRIALEHVDLALTQGASLGIVGESGSGKTTCLRIVSGLERPSEGTVEFRGTPYPRSRRSLRAIRKTFGVVLQDPYDSLNPLMTIGDIVAEPMRIHGVDRARAEERARSLLAAVGLPEAPLRNPPSRYSGGGRQRIAIARALALEPALLLCDEPTASLDISVQAQIVNLLLDLRAARDLSMIFVTHDLDLVRRVATEIVVMYAGRVVETGPVASITSTPRHPYTRLLHASIPSEDPTARRLVADATQAEVADDASGSEVDRAGCVFAGRCDRVQPRCRSEVPALSTDDAGAVACFFPVEEAT